MVEDNIKTSDPEVPETPMVPVTFKIQHEIETIHGVYTVRHPTGTVGARHFALIAKSAPDRFDGDGSPLYSPGQEEKLYEVFEEWSQKVLRSIIISGPVIDGVPFTYDLMPGEDQWSIFIAVSNMLDKGDRLFRVIK